MITKLLVGLLACASAAPQSRQHSSALSPFDGSLERFLSKERFTSNRFWDEWNRNLNQKMMQMETRLSDFNKNFPSIKATEGIEGNEYRIKIPLTGFEEKEIIVVAENGLLKIQAVHCGVYRNIYSEERPLPMRVGELNWRVGSWFYENGVLNIVFPVVQSSESGSKEVTPAAVTPVPDGSRKKTENPVYAHGDIDLTCGDLDKTSEIPTELPKVEATTNAVVNDMEYMTIKN